MGISDRQYFAWLTDALERFERESREFRAVAADRGVAFWVLAGGRTNPAIAFVEDALGRERTTLSYLDRFDQSPGVVPTDMNALGDIPADSCDVLMMTRSSYLIRDGAAFVRDTWRMLRPGGLFVVDWLHGAADAPALDLPGHHEYDGQRYPFLTTYCDAESLAESSGEFDALIAHLDRRTVGERVRRMLGGGARAGLTRASYVDTLRQALARGGKHLLEPSDLAPCFKVLFRDARYLHPLTGKFYLHLLTVLRPVGK